MPAAQNEGVRLALYFQRKAGDITSAFGILADKALFEVVRTALALPVGMSQADIDVQAAMITKRLDLADLKDPQKVDKVPGPVQRPLRPEQRQRARASAASIILGGGQSGIGTNMGLLASLQSVTLGRALIVAAARYRSTGSGAHDDVGAKHQQHRKEDGAEHLPRTGTSERPGRRPCRPAPG